ncbi:MAG: phospholipid carrier-dependent glycosyltransferase [Chloroflexi bacterium]|nr:phospholipid carrier-dependent glycosyltransferase [Chloroflexota bacterium]
MAKELMIQKLSAFIKDPIRLSLVLLLCVALGLRIYNVNFDADRHNHPDERWIIMVTSDLRWPQGDEWKDVLNPRKSTLNPFYNVNAGQVRRFAYGHLPLYILRFSVDALHNLSQIAPKLSFWPDLSSFVASWAQAADYDHINLVGRLISALFDTLTVFLVYLLGKRIYGRLAGLLAAACLTFTVLHIQLSHFYAFDVVLVTFLAASIYFTVAFVQNANARNAILAGLFAGLAVSTKFTAITVVGTLGLAHLLRYIVVVYQSRRATSQSPSLAWRSAGAVGFAAAPDVWLNSGQLIPVESTQQCTQQAARWLALSLIAAILAFALTSPFTLLDLHQYMDSINEQNDMVRGISDLPYTRQYRNTVPFLYHISNQLQWGMGWALGLVFFGGFLFVLYRAMRGKARMAEWLLLAWCVPYFLITGSFMVKFMRYFLLLIPFMAVMGAGMLVSWREWAKASMLARSMLARSMLARSMLAGQSDGAREYSRLSLPRGLAKASTLHPQLSTISQRLQPHIWRLKQGLAGQGWRWLVGVILLLGVLQAYSFMQIYTKPMTRVAASEWIYQNIPAGSAITNETWDDTLPYDMEVSGRYHAYREYRPVTMDLYNPDGEAKYQHILSSLKQADYVILTSNRLWGWVPRLADRYPVLDRYYQALFDGDLGFTQVADFTSRPHLGPFEFVDDRADESFTVYDHPRVMIFKKSRTLSDTEFRGIFQDALNRASGNGTHTEYTQGPADVPGAVQSGKSLMLNQPVDTLPVVTGWGWNSLATNIPWLAVIVWWLALQVLGVLALPVCYVVCRNLWDRGWLLSKTVGWLLVAYFVWLVGSLHLLANNLFTIIGAMILLAGLSLWLFNRQRSEMVAFWREQVRLIALGEALFGLAFLFFVFIRLLNPDLWQPWLGGEKFMEFAFLNATVRTPYFPPYDPYFAGGYINYYYYGMYLISVLIKMTGLMPSVAFNLAIPMLFGLTIVNAWTVGTNLVRSSKLSILSRRRIILGLLAAAFVAVVTNLDGMQQTLTGLAAAAGQPEASGLGALPVFISGLVKILSGQAQLAPLDYWRSSRIIPSTINEFPFFSFLFADLHPHMMNIPVTLSLLVLALNLILDGRRVDRLRQNSSENQWWPESGLGFFAGNLTVILSPFFILGFFVMAVILGTIAVTNTWDLPAYAGVVVLSVAIQMVLIFRQRRFNLLSLLLVLPIPALALVLFLPFFRNYQALDVGLGVIHTKDALSDYVIIWGVYLFLVLSGLVMAIVRSRRDAPAPLRYLGLLLRNSIVLPHFLDIHAALVTPGNGLYLAGRLLLLIAGVLVPLALFISGNQVLAVVLPLLLLTALLFFRPNLEPELLFLNLLTLVGLGILAGTQVIYLRDFLGGGDSYRMNTLFKFFIQAWVFLGISAAGWLAYVAWPKDITAATPASAAIDDQAEYPLSRKSGQVQLAAAAIVRYAWLGAAVVLIISASIYVIRGTVVRVNDRFPGARPAIGTLDGMDFMTVGVYTWPDQNHPIELRYDYEAIQWLLHNVKGTPVIAEAVLPYYREGGMRVASMTGLPTLLGAHQGEQRYGWQVGQRDGLARQFFESPDPNQALQLARQLDITYIYIGQLEKQVYSQGGIAKFEQMANQGILEIVFQNPKVRIYRILDAAPKVITLGPPQALAHAESTQPGR